ncbi:hypothetical protein F5887DRAFT_891825 [Amanita rubescens]|nr:hypothetical protein F5887DRAFT_891825 [Amanita rubescens]
MSSFLVENDANSLLIFQLRCDTVRVDGSDRPPTERRRSYSWAMKMRSSMTYGFGRLCKRGKTRWSSPDEVTWTGNPSMSTLVSRYMVALKKRKVCCFPNITMSSRALTSQDIKTIWEFNEKNYHKQGAMVTPSSEKQWGRERARRLVHAIITLSFVCLLRIDEALNICKKDIEIIGPDCLSVTLQKRKTDPFGGKIPNLQA